MIQNTLARILLMPFTLLYGAVITARNLMYDAGLLKSTRFNIPVISVGNLSIGGAGKSPHIEYLIKVLRLYLLMAVLSRGYKRKSKGFRFVEVGDNVLNTGDEPLQFKRKFRDIVVAVAESRTIAIPTIVKYIPDIQLVLLDDAFQHRAIIPGLNILLTTYDNPYTRDILLPSGRLREYTSASQRADIIIVTKCPEFLTQEEKKKMIEELALKEYQYLFFSRYHYLPPYRMFDPSRRITLDDSVDVILISAIADTAYLKYYLENVVHSLHELEYEDHHLFTERDIEYLDQVFRNRESGNKIILTTEKDAMRLEIHHRLIRQKLLPVYVLPIEVRFLFGQEKEFTDLVKSFLLNFKV